MLIQEAGADSYTVIISTNIVALEVTQNTETTLTARCMYGVKEIPNDEFAANWKLEWYKDFVLIEGQNEKTLKVTRDDVDGSSVYSVKLLHKEGDAWVVKAVDAQRITDESDEWQIKATPDGTNPDAISKYNDAKYLLSIYQNGELFTNGTIKWAWEVWNAINVKTYTGSGSSVTLTKEMAKCIPDTSNTDKYYQSDVSVEVEATIA